MVSPGDISMALRLVASGKVKVAFAGPGFVTGSVLTGSGRYIAGFERGSRFCSCGTQDNCTHATALRLVTDDSCWQERSA